MKFPVVFLALVAAALTASASAAHATVVQRRVMTCQTVNTEVSDTLVLTETNVTGPVSGPQKFVYSIDLYSHFDNKHVSHLKLSDNHVFFGPSLIAVDSFESRVGNLSLVAVFGVGSTRADKVIYDAEYRRESNNSGSFGLPALNAQSSASLMWGCSRN